MTSAGTSARTHEYELGHSAWELERLRRQAELVDPFTLQFYRDAGISKGMRVLDVGCGAGDTALLLAELVGDDGLVIGVDRAPAAVAAAGDRVEKLGKRNISFRLAGLDAIEQGEPFDAVVGRYVLMFNPDPSGVIRALGKLARPGGIIAFHESDFSGRRSNPPAPMYDRCGDLIVETFKKVGTDPYMGQGLYPAFVRAGLAPLMGLRALIGGPMADLRPVDLISGLGMTMAPVMKAHGLFSPDEIDAPSYQERMREEVRRLGSLVIGRFEIGAWSRLP
jgi:SAM-dependent methyltransferase